MVVRVLALKVGRVVSVAKAAPLVAKPVRLLTDAEILAQAIKGWTRSGLLPAEEIDMQIVLAIARIFQRGRRHA